MDARIFIRLKEFDRKIDHPQFAQLLNENENLQLIPVRELLVRASLCRSIMELGQKNINFGIMEKNQKRTKSIIICNKSEVPLLYNIKKSGSIASGDILINEGI